MSILKLEENKKELIPSNQNCSVNIPGEAVFCIPQNYNYLGEKLKVESGKLIVAWLTYDHFHPWGHSQRSTFNFELD